MNYSKACSVLPPGCYMCFFSSLQGNKTRVDTALVTTHRLLMPKFAVFNWWQISDCVCLCLRESMCFEWVPLFDLHLTHWLKPCERGAHGSSPLGSTFLCLVISKHTPLNINKAGHLAHVSPLNSHYCFAQTVKFFTVACACWYWPVVDAVGGWFGGSLRRNCDIDQPGISSGIGRKSHHQKLHLWQAVLMDSAKQDLWDEVGGCWSASYGWVTYLNRLYFFLAREVFKRVLWSQ